MGQHGNTCGPPRGPVPRSTPGATLFKQPPPFSPRSSNAQAPNPTQRRRGKRGNRPPAGAGENGEETSVSAPSGHTRRSFPFSLLFPFSSSSVSGRPSFSSPLLWRDVRRHKSLHLRSFASRRPSRTMHAHTARRGRKRPHARPGAVDARAARRLTAHAHHAETTSEHALVRL